MKLNENLRDISSVNLQMMEENKKKRNMVENDINYNNNQQGELLAMNGNNLEPMQNYQENEIIEQNEEIPQNYEIMREQNNNNNIEENNIQIIPKN